MKLHVCRCITIHFCLLLIVNCMLSSLRCAALRCAALRCAALRCAAEIDADVLM